MTSQRFTRRVPADAHQIADLRQAFAGWLSGLVPGMPEDRREEVVLASYEAMANSAEHAYRSGATGEVDVTAVYQPEALRVTVADYGGWKAPGDDPYRGRGLPLIEALTSTHSLDRAPHGTTVTMSWSLAGRPPGL